MPEAASGVLDSSTTEPLDDRVVVVGQDHFDEARFGLRGDESQPLNEVAPSEILRNDHVVSAAKMFDSHRDRKIPRGLLGRFHRLPLAKVPAQEVDVDHECERVLVRISISEH